MATLEDLTAQWRATESIRERARIEHEIWTGAGTQIRGDQMKREYIAGLLGISQYEAECRSVMNNAGQFAEPLWKMVEEEKFPVAKAWDLWVKAKARLTYTGKTITQCVEAVVADYRRERGCEVTKLSPDGTVKKYYRKKPSRLEMPKAQEAPVEPKPAPRSEKKKARKPEGGEVVDFDSPKVFWARLRKMISEWAGKQVAGADPIVVEGLWRDFETDIEVQFETFRNRLRGAAKMVQRDRAVSDDARRRRIVQACAVLNMAPPRRGTVVDMARAARQKRLLARAYHPDAHGGDETTRPEYEAVLKAYETLKEMTTTNEAVEPKQQAKEKDHAD